MGVSVRCLQAVMGLAIGVMASVPAMARPDRSIGVVDTGNANPWASPMDKPLDQMVGHKVVFLEKAPQEQAAGYSAFRVGAGRKGEAKVPAYQDFVGKRLLIEAVKPAPSGEFIVTGTTVETGVRLVARTRAHALADVAPVGDLYRAKRRWLGQTIYPRTRTLQTYDAATQRYGELAVRVNEPLKVVDVIWGMSATKPLWIVVQRTNGDQGFIATAYSWTNAYSDWWNMGRPWDDKIAESSIGQELRSMGLPNRMARAGFSTKADEDINF